MSEPTGVNANEAPSSAKEMASAAAQTVKQEIATFAASAQEKAVDKVEQKKEVGTETLKDFASAVRRAGEDLAQSDQSVAGRVVKQAADGLESLTQSLSNKRPEELFDAVRDFGRRNPAAFVAGALLVGLAAGRFLRSSAANQDNAPDRVNPLATAYRSSLGSDAWPKPSDDNPGFADRNTGDTPAESRPYGAGA